MKELLFKKYKVFKVRCATFSARIKRSFTSTTLRGNEFFNIPIIVNNRNRYTFLKELICWLEQNNYTNIYILDNDSTYAPLLEYYASTNHKVIYLGANFGYKALWKSELFSRIERGYYVYTDSDLLPTQDCPSNLVENLYKILRKYKAIEKIGVALKIDDIPDSYALKQDVIRVESQYWLKKVEGDIYDAPVDTTFALYRPYAQGDAEECKAYRVAGNLIFKHQPWYENSAEPTAEDVYYRKSVAGGSSYWLNFK
ncbi:MAG: glycosyltransferase family 2 protein [Bacteroidetes bacterium]|nr:glycosyltransferase family 2 protein [Bacteroidota bacterium]